MEKWGILQPSVRPSKLTPNIHLIGRLPAEAYICILQYLPIGDLPSFALASTKFALLSRDDRVWKRKLGWLDFRGPGRIEEDVSDENGKGGGVEGGGGDKALLLSDSEPLFAAVEDDFGAFLGDGDGDVSLVQDDGFGEFQDFDDDFGGGVTDPPLLKEDAANDLMMMFEDEAISPMTTNGTSSTNHRPTLQAKLTFVASVPPFKTPTSPNAPNRPVNSRSKLQLFQHYHSLLLPYYLSLMNHTTSSLLFTSPTLTPSSRSQLLSTLVRFCSPLLAPSRSLPQRMTVLRNVQSSMDFFESALLAEFERCDTRGDEEGMKEKAKVLWGLNKGMSVIQVFVQKREIFYDQTFDPLKNLVKMEGPTGDIVDGIDFGAMDSYMKNLLYIVNREGSLIARVFPSEADFLLYFSERIANDVLSDYITTLLSAAQPLTPPLFLLATAATFGQVYRLVETVLEIEPKNPVVTKERVEDVVFKMFEPLMDDYLQEEAEWIREVLEGVCEEWDQKTASALAISDPTFLASSNPALVKRNVLAGFTKVLLLPVTIIPKTAVYGLNAITVGATGAFNTFALLGSLGSSSANAAAKGRIPALPVMEVEKVEEEKLPWTTESLEAATTISTTPTPSLSPTPSSTTKSSNFDRLQLLLSLDTALQLIQANRDVLKRIQTFVRYPGTYGQKVRDAIEEVFIILLQTLSEKHVGPAFTKATSEMGRYKAEEHEVGTQVAPLVQFFELVHIGDTIQQMVEVYFDKEMATYIDKKDFLNAVVREKKRFETSLDDAVAQGLNAGVNILMNQVEHIISLQGPRDFCPPEGEDLHLEPTKTCTTAIEVLVTHCDMLKGSTDKQILEVFHQEVGIRLHGILLKHLKKLIISIEGGFQLISDLNAYHYFVSNLRQPNITAYFTSLKMVGEIYIVDSPKDLGILVRDVSRYDGTLSADDLYECVQRRADWKLIDKAVEKQLFGLKLADDCLIS